MITNTATAAITTDVVDTAAAFKAAPTADAHVNQLLQLLPLPQLLPQQLLLLLPPELLPQFMLLVPLLILLQLTLLLQL